MVIMIITKMCQIQWISQQKLTLPLGKCVVNQGSMRLAVQHGHLRPRWDCSCRRLIKLKYSLSHGSCLRRQLNIGKVILLRSAANLLGYTIWAFLISCTTVCTVRFKNFRVENFRYLLKTFETFEFHEVLLLISTSMTPFDSTVKTGY